MSATDIANTLIAAAQDAYAAATTAATSLPFSTFTNQPSVFARPLTQYGTVDTPTVTPLPAPPDASALVPDFGATLSEVQATIDSLQSSWILTYFPAAMPSGLDPLMSQIVAGTIVTAAEQEILWERARGQTLRAAAQFEKDAISSWAARGFSLPGGVVANQLAMKNQELLRANADLAAQQAIKALELRIDAVKFAAEVGTRLRLGLMQGISQLIAAYLRVPEAAANYAAAVADARRSAYSAIAEYYRASIAAAEISLKADVANADNDLRYAAVAGEFIARSVRTDMDARVAQADVFAKTAAAAYSGFNTMAGFFDSVAA